MKAKFFYIGLLSVFLFSSLPTRVYACGLLDPMGCLTEIAKQDADKQVQLAKINSDAKQLELARDTDLRRFDVAASIQIKQAEANVEASKALGVAAQANAQADRDKFIAQVNAEREKIDKAYDVQIAGLNNTAEIMIAGINQVGIVKKAEVDWSGARALTISIMYGVGFLILAVGAVRFAINGQKLLALRLMFPGNIFTALPQQKTNIIEDKEEWLK